VDRSALEPGVTRGLRRAHRVILTTLAIVLPVAFALAFVLR